MTEPSPGIRPQVVGAEAAGIELSRLAKVAQLSETDLKSDRVLEFTQAERLWVALSKLADDPAIALHAAEAVPYGAFDVLDYIVGNTPTFKEGLDALARYFKTIRSGIEPRVTHRKTDSILQLHWPVKMTGPLRRFSCEFTFACIVLRFRQSSGQPWSPSALHVAHADPGYLREYERIFACPIHFSAGEDALIIDDQTRMLPHPEADARLRVVLERSAKQLEACLPPPQKTTADLRKTLLDLIPDTPPRLNTVAKALGMSVRTLHRRLTDEGTSFQAELDTVRSEMAADLLSRRNLSISEVAYLLGFTEVSAFSRAFRRWYGMAPAVWRRGREEA